MTNLSLDKLRKGTGAFISESDFQVIQLEYLDYLKLMQKSFIIFGARNRKNLIISNKLLMGRLNFIAWMMIHL